MTLTTHDDLIQGSPEWHAARLGIVTASVVGKLLTPTLKVADNATSRGVAYTLIAERLTGHIDETYSGPDMWRGHEDEPIARAAYADQHAPVTEAGFMVRDIGGYRLGYSPDGLVGDDGLIEIKSRLQKIHLATILSDETPTEFMAQMQCGLLVSGREWIDFVSFCGGMPLWVQRVFPDPAWHEAIIAALETFESTAADVTDLYQYATEGLPLTDRAPDPYAEIEIDL